MNIVLATYVTDSVTSGVLKYQNELSYHLSHRGHSVDIATPEQATGIFRLLTALLVKCAGIFGKQSRRLAVEIGTFGRMYSVIKKRRGKIDVIHCMDISSGVAAQLATRGAVPVVVTAHFNIHPIHEAVERGELSGVGLRLTRRVFEFYFSRIRCFISPSHFSRACIQNIVGEDCTIRVIPHGVDDKDDSASVLQPVCSVFEGRKVVLSVGRLDKLKNHLKLIAIAEQCEDPRVLFAIVGDGPEKMCLQEQIIKKHLEDRVILMGKRNDVASLLKQSQLYIHVSKVECFGYTVFESLAAGVPVLAARTGAVGEILGESLHECLFDLDAPAQEIWAQAKALLADQALREGIMQKGRILLREQLSVLRMVDETEAVYGELLEIHHL